MRPACRISARFIPEAEEHHRPLQDLLGSEKLDSRLEDLLPFYQESSGACRSSDPNTDPPTTGRSYAEKNARNGDPRGSK